MDIIRENLNHEGFGPGEVLSGDQYSDLNVGIVVVNIYIYAVQKI